MAACCAFSACSDDDDYPGRVEFLSGEFVVSKTQIALAGTQEQTLTIKSPVVPEVTSDAQWLHAGAVSGGASSSGIYSVTVSADENPQYDPRTGTITVKAGSRSQTVTVTQYGAETVNVVSVTPSATLDPNGGSVTVTFAATGDVDIQTPSWLAKSTPRSLDESSVTFTYSANYGEEARGGDIVISLVSDASISAVIAVSQAKAEATTDMSCNAVQLAAKMYAGINIGNTMECPDTEGAWSGAVVNESYIRGLKQLGFNAVRVPCAWDSHVSDAATNTIDPAWLDRVDQVVGWIVSNDMYAIVNIHWDGGWLEESVINGYSDAVDKKQRDYWTQIANKLNHFDQHLLLAGMNEPGNQAQSSIGASAIDAIMKYQQTFVDAVRATGGNNATRVLVHQAPYTNIDQAVAGVYSLPEDAVADRAMVEIHFYDPYQFTLMENDESWGKVWWYWGADNHVAGSDRNANSSSEESMVSKQFKKIHDKFVAVGIPAILGEYAVTTTRSGDGFDPDKWKASRSYWNEVVTREAKSNGCVPFYWETGGDINRNNGAVKNDYAIDGIMKGAAAGTYPF